MYMFTMEFDMIDPQEEMRHKAKLTNEMLDFFFRDVKTTSLM